MYVYNKYILYNIMNGCYSSHIIICIDLLSFANIKVVN